MSGANWAKFVAMIPQPKAQVSESLDPLVGADLFRGMLYGMCITFAGKPERWPRLRAGLSVLADYAGDLADAVDIALDWWAEQ